MKTRVKNLATGTEEVYVNELSLTDNIVNSIILKRKETGQLTNPDHRAKYRSSVVESTSTITGRQFAYCIEHELHASYMKP